VYHNYVCNEGYSAETSTRIRTLIPKHRAHLVPIRTQKVHVTEQQLNSQKRSISIPSTSTTRKCFGCSSNAQPIPPPYSLTQHGLKVPHSTRTSPCRARSARRPARRPSSARTCQGWPRKGPGGRACSGRRCGSAARGPGTLRRRRRRPPAVPPPCTALGRRTAGGAPPWASASRPCGSAGERNRWGRGKRRRGGRTEKRAVDGEREALPLQMRFVLGAELFLLGH
jgi:hypothetical protein